MSRIARNPVEIPGGVEVKLGADTISVKGSKGELSMALHSAVEMQQDGNTLVFAGRNDERENWAMAGTLRSLVSNMVIGVTTGFERRLLLNGVGYRAKAEGKTLNLVLGFSHPINYKLPDGVTADTPSQTEIVLTGADKQRLGQAAAEIRAFRPPEPYKGKGVRYADEYVRRKEAKKK